MNTDETIRRPIKGFIKGTRGPTLQNIIDYGYIYDVDEMTVRNAIIDLKELGEIKEIGGRYFIID